MGEVKIHALAASLLWLLVGSVTIDGFWLLAHVRCTWHV